MTREETIRAVQKIVSHHGFGHYSVGYSTTEWCMTLTDNLYPVPAATIIVTEGHVRIDGERVSARKNNGLRSIARDIRRSLDVDVCLWVHECYEYERDNKPSGL
jgi:hypothetical protein